MNNSQNQSSKFRTKNWFGINDDSRGPYNTNSQIKFKYSMLKSNLCGYSDAYILVNPIEDGWGVMQKVHLPIFPCNFYKRWN